MERKRERAYALLGRPPQMKDDHIACLGERESVCICPAVCLAVPSTVPSRVCFIIICHDKDV
ncbi:hypothetical protein NQZ68_017630 [Dissostichus eleginoides]|nr:hypothetical protein NQZ68_017630 [Dissostichus eleginoides]